MSDGRPSIAELQQLDPCKDNDCCADARGALVNAAPVLLEIAAAALAYRDASDGTDDCFDAWVVLETALSKVRP